MITVTITDQGAVSTSRHRTSSIVAAIGRAVRKRYGPGLFFYPDAPVGPLSRRGWVGRPDGFGEATPVTGPIYVEVD